MNRLYKYLVTVVSGVLALGIAVSVQAALIADLDGGAPVPAGPPNQFAYNYTLRFGDSNGAERLQSGDFITLYDVGGPLNPLINVTVPPNWSVSAFTPSAPNTLVPDNPLLQNVTFVYTPTPATTTLTADTSIPGFSLVTTTSAPANIAFTSQTTDNLGPPAELGRPIGHVGSVTGPLGIIPEPRTVVLAGVGAVGALLVFRRTRRA